MRSISQFACSFASSKAIRIYKHRIDQFNNAYIDIPIPKIHFYLTIRLRARNFYEVVVEEGEARINYHLIEFKGE